MVSLRFPFLFSQPTKNPLNHHVSSHSFSAAAMAGSVAAAVGVGIGMGLAVSHKTTNQRDPFLQKALDFFISHYRSNCSSRMWGSLSLTDNLSETVVESKTGVSFPAILSDTRRLLGIGLRKKSVLGLKNIDVYAFGVYVDDDDVKNALSEKYGRLSVSELKENNEFYEDVMDKDICMTVRLQIVYGRLSIRSVRSAFEESVGSRLKKFGGADNKELLQRFTSQFKDEYKLPRGSVIDISREHDQVLRTTRPSQFFDHPHYAPAEPSQYTSAESSRVIPADDDLGLICPRSLISREGAPARPQRNVRRRRALDLLRGDYSHGGKECRR